MGAFKKYLNENEEMLKKIFAILDEMSEEEIDEFGAYLYTEFFDPEEDSEEDMDESDDEEESDSEESDEYVPFTKEDVKEMIDALGEEMLDDVLDMLEEESDEEDDEEESDEMDESLNEEWSKPGKVNFDKVVKLKTKKSGENYFYVVSSDAKEKEYYVVTPKAFNNGDTDKTMTVKASDVVSVSTDEMPDKEEKGGKKPSGVTVHTAKFGKKSDDEDMDEANMSEAELNEVMARRMKTKKMNKKKRKFMTKTKAELRKTASIRKRVNRKTSAKRKKSYRANKAKIKSYQASRAVAMKKGRHIVKVRRGA